MLLLLDYNVLSIITVKKQCPLCILRPHIDNNTTVDCMTCTQPKPPRIGSLYYPGCQYLTRAQTETQLLQSC